MTDNNMQTKKTDDKVWEEVKNSMFSSIVMLGHSYLKTFPKQLLGVEWLASIRRLDLSFNDISQLPKSLCALSSLRELWLQSNPITELPTDLSQIRTLEVIDVRNTKLCLIPPEFSKLENLFELDCRGTPAADFYAEEHGVSLGDIFQLKAALRTLSTRKELDEQLFEGLYGEHYIMDAEKPHIAERIMDLVNVRALFLSC